MQKLQTGLIPNSALTKWAMQKYTIPMTNCSDIALIELKFFIKFWCVFFLELIMQSAYGLISRQMSPMSYMMYSIQHYILLCKMKFDNDLRHVSGLSRLLWFGCYHQLNWPPRYTIFWYLLNALVHKKHPLSSPKNLVKILDPIYKTQEDSVKHAQ